MGVKEQLIFPEITYDQVEKVRGMDIVFTTTAKTDEEARVLLELLGMPFEKQEGHMAKTSLKVKQQRAPKYSTQAQYDIPTFSEIWRLGYICTELSVSKKKTASVKNSLVRQSDLVGLVGLEPTRFMVGRF